MDLNCDEAVLMNSIGVEEAVLADRELWPSGAGAHFAHFLCYLETVGIPGVDEVLLWKAYGLTPEEIERNIDLRLTRCSTTDQRQETR